MVWQKNWYHLQVYIVRSPTPTSLQAVIYCGMFCTMPNVVVDAKVQRLLLHKTLLHDYQTKWWRRLQATKVVVIRPLFKNDCKGTVQRTNWLKGLGAATVRAVSAFAGGILWRSQLNLTRLTTCRQGVCPIRGQGEAQLVYPAKNELKICCVDILLIISWWRINNRTIKETINPICTFQLSKLRDADSFIGTNTPA